MTNMIEAAERIDDLRRQIDQMEEAIKPLKDELKAAEREFIDGMLNSRCRSIGLDTATVSVRVEARFRCPADRRVDMLKYCLENELDYMLYPQPSSLAAYCREEERNGGLSPELEKLVEKYEQPIVSVLKK